MPVLLSYDLPGPKLKQAQQAKNSKMRSSKQNNTVIRNAQVSGSCARDSYSPARRSAANISTTNQCTSCSAKLAAALVYGVRSYHLIATTVGTEALSAAQKATNKHLHQHKDWKLRFLMGTKLEERAEVTPSSAASTA
jgi:hypothetical protein